MFTTPDFTIYSLGQQHYDVFFGMGWDNWSRFRRENHILKLIKGRPMPKDLYETLLKEMNHVSN